MSNRTEQWGIFELALDGPADGNPFVDVTLRAEFTQGGRTVTPSGFYDGDGVYRVRFMPDTPGTWTYVTRSNVAALDGVRGAFECDAAGAGNHGPVQVHDTFHFAYADGTPYYPFGTTCYAWTHQGDALEEQTLATLAQASFNKLRMCVFPKHYPFNKNEPVHHPFVRSEDGTPDVSRFNPAFFHHFEQRLAQLGALGIQADIILWHPYDRWGYAWMDEEDDVRYLRYVIARLAAYRHVWWSLANEFDFLLTQKPMARWDQFFAILMDEDPYGRLRSIHNGDPQTMYDHTKPGVTHVCIQNSNIRQVVEWRAQFGKPIVNDELEYEGNITYPWGSISAEEETHRFWIMVANGGYAGHGETYMHPDDILWWSKGGVLHGESWQRIAFLRAIIEDAPAGGLTPLRGADSGLFGPFSRWYWTRYSGGVNGDYQLIYFENYRPTRVPVWLPDGEYAVDVIDTWAMSVTPARVNKLTDFPPYSYDRHSLPGNAPAIPAPTHEIELPGKPRLAVRIRRMA